MTVKKEAAVEVEGQHNSIKVAGWNPQHGLSNPHPDAQWFHHAGAGLFLHWGISSVRGECDLSWGMITGWELAKMTVTQEEIDSMIHNKKYAAESMEMTPHQYFQLAEGFLAKHYHPREWIRLAKEAGFTYAVLTTRHHDGFALWPSRYGEFNTADYMGGRDLVREFADACREYGLRVGFYYSPPDWYFNQKHMSYMIYTAKRKNPGLPELDVNYDPVTLPDSEEMHRHNLQYADYVHGQLNELLTEYGKVDILWFDGSMPDGLLYPMERIRRLQPGIVVNHRMHGDGDFETREVREADERPKAWWEFCTQWAVKGWAYLKEVPYRPLSEITSEYVRTLSWGGNYLLNIGPKSDGTLSDTTLEAMKELTEWHHRNRQALSQIEPLPDTEICSVPASLSVHDLRYRYLYLLPGSVCEVTYHGIGNIKQAYMLDTLDTIHFRETEGNIQFEVPAVPPDQPVRVLCIELAG